MGFGDWSMGRDTFGATLGCAIVTNEDFIVYVCDSATTRPSYQITLGKLVNLLYSDILVLSSERQSARMSEIKNVSYTWMTLNKFKRNCLMPVGFKGLKPSKFKPNNRSRPTTTKTR